jgi:hypothetical protein
MTDTTRAIMSLTPNAQWAVRGDEVVWLDEEQDQPTKEEIQEEIARLEAEYEANEYQRLRAAEYPDWGTQLDYIYHHGVEEWKTDIVDPVKARYPKPE